MDEVGRYLDYENYEQFLSEIDLNGNSHYQQNFLIFCLTGNLLNLKTNNNNNKNTVKTFGYYRVNPFIVCTHTHTHTHITVYIIKLFS